MEELHRYLERIFENTYKTEESLNTKNEMEQYLLETIEELKKEGKTEQEAIKKAIEGFGNIEDIKKELGETYNSNNKRKIDWKEQGANYFKHLLEGTLPDEKIEEIIVKIKQKEKNALSELREIKDIKNLAFKLQNQSIETISLVLLQVRPVHGAEIILSFEIEKVIKVFKVMIEKDSRQGLRVVTNILNNLPREYEKNILELLDEKHGELSKKIIDTMFLLEDIMKLDEHTLQIIMNNITDNTLIAKALRTCKEELKNKILKAISEGRRRIIQDEEESLGRVKISDIEDAQYKLIETIKKLEKQGYIIIQRGEEDIIN